MKQISLLLALAFVNLAVAQHNTSGKLEMVVKDGLYEISLPNQVRSFSKRDLSDFRIVDNEGNEAPYFIRAQNNSFATNEYVPFVIVSKNVLNDTSSTIVFQNPFKVIEELVLSTANYSGSKTYKILGSKNLTEWFGVLNTGSLTNLQTLNSTSVDKTITFPRCSYKYLKIVFNDKNSLPINVLKVGSLSSSITNRALQKVITKSITTVDLLEEKKTQIHIKFTNKEIINQIQFEVSKPEFFNRNVQIYTKEIRVIKKKEESYNKRLINLQLNSDKALTFNISEIFEDEIYIEIENKDSNKLSIAEINFFQKPLYAVASLKANTNYKIKTGSKTMVAPEYDLSFFKNSISENLPRLEINNIVKEKAKPVEVKEKSLWETSWFMWFAMAITGLIIVSFSSSLVKDLKKDK